MCWSGNDPRSGGVGIFVKEKVYRHVVKVRKREREVVIMLILSKEVL